MPRVSSAFAVLILSAAALCQGTKPGDLKKLRSDADAAVQAGNFDAAAASFRKITEADPKDARAWHMLGYSLHAAGKLDEALPIHLKAAEFPATAGSSIYNAACVHALKGKKDDAFVCLDKAIANGFDDVELLGTDKDLASLRDDPRFAKVQEALKSKVGDGSMQAFAQTTERRSSRVVWFSRNGVPGQLAIDWAPIAWNDDYEAAIAGGKLVGRRWRFGGDFWTTLDNSMPLRFGDVDVPPGYWYLTLQQKQPETFVLTLHDAAATKKQRLDPVFADKLQGGIDVPLGHEKSADTAKQLEVTIAPKGSKTDGALEIRFGGHQLTTPVKMQVE